MNMICNQREAFLFSVLCMLHLDSNSPSKIYYAFKGSEIPRLARTTSDSNTFIKFANQLLKRMQKHSSKHRFIIFKLIKNNF